MSQLPVRALATQIIHAVISQGHSLNTALSEFSPQLKNEQDRGLLKELCFGTIRWQPRLSLLLTQLLKIPLKNKDQDINALLIVGFYQLIYTRIPDHAAVSETVAAAYALKKPWAAKLINGVLRQFIREKDKILNTLDNNFIAKYAHPAWLIETVQTAWPNEWESILIANNQHPPHSCRINARQFSREEYLSLLEKSEIKATPIEFTNHGIFVDNALPVTQLPHFASGAISVQDGAAQLAADLLELKKDQRVLDACAAPGGKTTHIVEKQPDLAHLVAVDIDEERIKLIKENCERLKLSAEIIIGDASQPDTWWDQQLFDRILCDVPCSATGIIRRHPDIKLLRRETDIAQLAQHQWQILNALWPLLKPSGILVYASCSILPTENIDLLQKFLLNTPDAKEIPINSKWGMQQIVGKQILPGMNDMDGFYYAKLQKL
jgi:16S rRNA (cytosine967-C5)-methyltransferase